MIRPALLALCLPAACAAPGFLPQDGPARSVVTEQATNRIGQVQPLSYTLVLLDDPTLVRLAAVQPRPRLSQAGTTRPSGTIGVGDVVAVTIFEADSGGLFLPKEPGTRSGNYVTLPPQQVDGAGTLTIPFAGPLGVVGLTTVQVQRKIEGALAGKALSPQAIVTISQRLAAPVAVLGEIAGAAHFALDPDGERVLGAIARAGGPKYPAYESLVTLQRMGAAQHAMLSDIAQDPSQNVALQPGDTLYVAHEPRYFLSFGATGVTTSLSVLDRRIPFGDAELSLADAIARAGGLQDDRANARAVFVYRLEAAETLRALGQPGAGPDPVPTVYQLDLANPAGLFHAGRFAMHREDILFVSNAPATDLAKFLALVSLATGSTAAARTTVR